MASMFPSPFPTLPEFGSLLIHGKYHPSAPLHLALSHCARNSQSRAVVITPSRERFKKSLEDYKDEWFSTHGCELSTASIADKVKILYPPTPSHLMLLLTLFHESKPSYKDYFSDKATFDTTPTLLVINDLSSYLADDLQATMSSYLMLVSNAFSSVASLSTGSTEPTALAIFDSSLTELELPLLRPVAPEFQVRGENEDTRRYEYVLPLARRYFDCVGVFEEEDMDIADIDIGLVRRCKLCLTMTKQGGRVSTDSDGQDVVWEWTERREAGRRTTFQWLQHNTVM